MKIHLDMDCFFASCERVRNPKLCGKPIAVGGRSDTKIFEKSFSARKLYDKNSGAFVPNIFYPTKKDNMDFENFFIDKNGNKTRIRGIITTASYEARAYGLKTGMTIRESLTLCPHLLVLPPNHLLYHEFSHKLFEFLKQKIPLVEQYSVDEFFADLSGWIRDENLLDFCKNLQHEIFDEFSLPITIGIAKSKWAAKLVTNSAKPFGVKEVKEDKWTEFIRDIPIQKFPGIAKGYRRRLKSRGIETLGEIRGAKNLFYSWKKPGILLYKRVLGIDNESIAQGTPRKSIGISRTFDPIKQRCEVKRRVAVLARNLAYTILKLNLNPTSYFLKIKYENFLRTKHRVTTDRLFNEKFFKSLMLEIFDNTDIYVAQKIKYIGISTSNFMEYKHKPFDLLSYEKDTKFRKIGNSIQSLRQKYGIDIVKNGSEI
ncbi:MAG: DNA polymerase IV [Sulfurospirillum sp.]